MVLQGKVALITGASGGMGRATAVEFAREGARALGIHYSSSPDRAAKVVEEVKRLGADARALRADVGKPEEARGLVEAVVKAWGNLDVLVCYAGHPFRRDEWFTAFEDLTPDMLMAPLRTDLLGSAYCCQAAARHMKARRSGRIVLVASTPAITGDVVGIPYLIAKAGVLGLTRALALSLGPANVQVNAVAPGSIDTEAMTGLTQEERRALAEEPALKRLGTPREVARKVVFLASEDSDFTTGQTLVVDGGYALR